jgi:hypothetical protein
MALAVRVRCSNMQLAADIIQDIAKYFSISDLSTDANFPDEFAQFGEVLFVVYVRMERNKILNCCRS